MQVAGRHCFPRERECVFVVGGQQVCDAGDARVYVAPSEAFGVDLFARGRLDQGWTAEKDGSLVLHDDGYVAHRRHIGAARRA